MFSLEEIKRMNDVAAERELAERRVAPVAAKPGFDLVNSIIAFEDGELDEDGLKQLFQYLVDTGMAWKLQGFYGRTAQDLIARGLVDPGHGQKVAAN